MPPAKPIVSDLGAPPSLDWIPLERLVVDKRYQRALGVKNERHVRRISSGFRWNRYQPIVVTEAGDNFAVIDGQHRLAAARLHPKIDSLPCYVVDAPTVADQAEIFISANMDRIGVGRIHQFWAAHAADADWAVRIHRLCAGAGVEISRTPRSNLPPRTTVATFTIQKLFPLGDDAIASALSMLMASHGDTPDTFRSATIAALARIAAGEGFDQSRMVQILAGLDLTEQLARAKAKRATAGGKLELALEEILRKKYDRRVGGAAR